MRRCRNQLRLFDGVERDLIRRNRLAWETRESHRVKSCQICGRVPIVQVVEGKGLCDVHAPALGEEDAMERRGSCG